MLPRSAPLANLRNILSLLALAFMMASPWIFSPGCANVIPPTGGPRDSLPPVLVRALPNNGTTGFAGKKIELEFDEYVQLDNNQSEIIVNPPPVRQPSINHNLKTVTIKLFDTLQPNTTYQINFGNSIKDVNENNPFKNFTYVFSTGSYVDSLEMTGNISNAETGLPDSTMIIMLYRSDEDSAVAKRPANFVARPDGKGDFFFTHLPPGRFFVFAIKDEGMRQYTNAATPFAFETEPVTISPNSRPDVELRYFVEQKEPEKTQKSNTQATPNNRNQKQEDKQVKVQVEASSSQKQDILSPLKILANKPIKTYDSTKFLFSDTLGNPLTISKWELDTVTQKLSMHHAWKESTHYQIIIQKGFITDTSGVANTKADTVRFATKAEAEYGTVNLVFNNLEVQQHPVLQWVENNAVVHSLPITNNRMKINLFKPGAYQLRILYDENQNGIWDTGNYWLRKQPERVVGLEQKVTVRPAWDNEFEINL